MGNRAEDGKYSLIKTHDTAIEDWEDWEDWKKRERHAYLNPDREQVIHELSTDEKYLHAVYGVFTPYKVRSRLGFMAKSPDYKGFQLVLVKGNRGIYSEAVVNEAFDLKRAHSSLWLWHMDEHFPQFKARLTGTYYELSGTFFVTMFFKDNTYDPRPDTFVVYFLLIPKDDVVRIKPAIEKGPSIIVEVFEKVAGNYDNSKGKLEFDWDWYKTKHNEDPMGYLNKRA